ncbi:MAG: hypothetical protein HY052_06685 [Proteobacteria bacterium]|nr:hypothetical protein [Pseudomonadota bacterium]
MGGWTVGPVPTQSADGISYCSMKNSYKDGQELVFVRNATGSNSIGLDFKKDLWVDGSRYDVTVRVGALTRRRAAIAVGKQVVIMKVGVDRGFYAALKDKNTLSLSWTGQQFDFGLTGVSGAMQALSACSEQLGTHDEAAQETAPVVRKKHVPKKKTFHQRERRKPDRHQEAETIQQELELERLKAENQKLAAEIKNEREKVKPIQQVQNPVTVLPQKSVDPLGDWLELSHVAEGRVAWQEDRTAHASYSWVSDHIFGFAQEMPEMPGKSLNDRAVDYLGESAARCKGSFSQRLGNVTQVGNKQMLEAEMVCLDRVNNASAAVLFISSPGSFYVIAQEGTTEQVPVVLSKRDLIKSAVRDNPVN